MITITIEETDKDGQLLGRHVASAPIDKNDTKGIGSLLARSVGGLMYHTEARAEIPLLIANTTLVYTGALVVTAFVAGRLSDKLGRRKVFVWTSTAVFAAGTFALIHVHSVPAYYVLEFILGFAYGIYVGVDLALVVDVLPNPDDAGKDLGVFNIANALPQTAAPAIGRVILAATAGADGADYTVWFTVCAIACLIGAAVIFPIKKGR